MSLLDILGWESLVLLVLIFANGLFSMTEVALISSRRPKLQQMAEDGDSGAAKALELIAQPGRFLAAVQVGITLVGTLAGAYGGATIAEKLAPTFAGIPLLARYANATALFVVVLGVTYLQVTFGELVPKALALRHPEAIARRAAKPMDRLSKAAGPVVQFLNLSTNLLLRLIGVRAAGENPVTEEEIAQVLAQGTREGVFEASQHEMMESVIEMGDRRITALMTARPDIAWLDADDDLVAVRAALVAHPYSRFPVCRGGFDDLLGVVHAKDLLARSLAGEPLALATLAKPAPVIPDSVPVLKALEAFRASGESMAFVSDEYGSILGLVTLDDVMRNILGDALEHPRDEEARHEAGGEPDAVRRADGSWLVDGVKPLVEVEEMLDDSAAFTGEDEENYQTLGGYVMGRLDRIPRAGDRFESAGWRYEVMDMDGNRVDKVMISRVSPGESDELRVTN
ncbi:MAG TPA: hemolysin family protein [Fibrobacteria bacterium]|jgi:putative hemolysin|nr:hemolysin family protein [Fibrobacteria bacterium]